MSAKIQSNSVANNKSTNKTATVCSTVLPIGYYGNMQIHMHIDSNRCIIGITRRCCCCCCYITPAGSAFYSFFFFSFYRRPIDLKKSVGINLLLGPSYSTFRLAGLTMKRQDSATRSACAARCWLAHCVPELHILCRAVKFDHQVDSEK